MINLIAENYESHRTQNPVLETMCGFDSHLRHHLNSTTYGRFSPSQIGPVSGLKAPKNTSFGLKVAQKCHTAYCRIDDSLRTPRGMIKFILGSLVYGSIGLYHAAALIIWWVA